MSHIDKFKVMVGWHGSLDLICVPCFDEHRNAYVHTYHETNSYTEAPDLATIASAAQAHWAQVHSEGTP